jgi:hypothetical protein
MISQLFLTTLYTFVKLELSRLPRQDFEIFAELQLIRPSQRNFFSHFLFFFILRVKGRQTIKISGSNLSTFVKSDYSPIPKKDYEIFAKSQLIRPLKGTS